MSDFMSRLVARSMGERPAVRPRIRPAFAQLAERSEHSRGGEILGGAPEATPAIAPLPFEKTRGVAERAAHPTRNVESQAALPRPPALPQANLPAAKSSGKPQGKKTSDAGERQVIPAKTEVAAMNVNSSAEPETIRSQRSAEVGEHSRLEPRPSKVFQEIVGKQETKEALQVVALAAERTVAPPLVSDLRPAIRNAEQPLEAPRKRPATESPAIQVTIGKIEVRASIAAPKYTERKLPSGAMSLEEYQRLRSRRSAG